MERNSVQTVTLMNSIIGVGILSMPFCFQKCGIILSLILLLLSAYITKLICGYMIKSAIISRRKNFEQIAFCAFGSYGKLLVELCVVGYLLGTCVAYFVVVGDLGPQIAAKILSMNESSTLRSWVMIVVTVVCIVPLGLLRNVDSLATVCTASLGFYLCLALKVVAESSEQISKPGWFDNLALWRTEGILQCLPIFSMALSCQMQLFEIYATMPTTSLDKMNRVVQRSTNFCACIYSLIGFFGYVAFNGHHFSGNILVNFSPSFVSDIIKIGFVLSVAFSFPLAIFPCRVSLYSLLYKRSHSDTHFYIPESKFRPLTLLIVGAALILGLLIPSIEVVIGLVGSTIGVAICIIIPAACYMHICRTNISEKQLAQVMIVFGFLIMVLGTYANLDAIDRVPVEKYEGVIEKKITPLPVIVVDRPVENVDEKIEELKPKQELIQEVKEVPLVTEKIVSKNEVPAIAQSIKQGEAVTVMIEKVIPPPESPPIEKKPDGKTDTVNLDAILKEEKEIAVEEKDKIQKEIIELQSAKKELEAQVQNIKEQLVKKNEETQQLVLKKFDEIAEKIDQKASKEKEVSTNTAKPMIEASQSDGKVLGPSDVKKDPIVRMLTEQGKLNAKPNDTIVQNVEKRFEIKQKITSQAVEVKLSDNTTNNETDLKTDQQRLNENVKTSTATPVALAAEKKEEKAEPLPPLPIEQEKEPEVLNLVNPIEKQREGETNVKKDEDAGSQRDLLSVRNKRNTFKYKTEDSVLDSTSDEKDENCNKKTGQEHSDNGGGDRLEQQFQKNHQIIEDIIGKDKLLNMIRSDVLMDESKLFKK
ncbi:putative sodium-coupled neutral amino acid transporter 10 [Toxorhynchites rutilus septentrionalis]|uniref:putative sodium-coupled neutral amino acid transporter 10 n=1 Tax=Toxorhynchites rutilus septentrionalis TaxID=329112 RepID=UPI002479C89C|nr:putative sodium-coupled neutral amino acid transporter 10 [Toxorhynchites rutilus septentrionalis]